MPKKFWVKEVKTSGEITESIVEAESKADIYEIVKSRGGTVIKIEDRGDGKSQFSLSDLGQIKITEEKISIKDLATFSRQGHTMLNAGMSLTRVLEILSIQTTNKRFKGIISEIQGEIQKGYQFSVALKMHPKIFPSLYVSMVESGEMTGNLDAILLSLSDHYTKESKLMGKIRGALAYPIVIGIIATIVLAFMLVYVVPIIAGIFEDAGNDLPQITVGLINASNFVRTRWYVIIGAIIAIVVSIKIGLKNESFRLFKDKLVNRLPIVGKASTKITTARFSRTLSTLLKSGIPIVQGLKAAALVTNNLIVINGVKEISEEVKKGQSLNLLLSNLSYFPTMMVSMVAIGEESGDLENLLERTADYYDSELEEAMDTMTSLIEPIMIVSMALIVAYMVIALMLPILDMAGNFI